MAAASNNDDDNYYFLDPLPDMVLRPYTYVDDPLPICAAADIFYGDQPPVLVPSAVDSSSVVNSAIYQATDLNGSQSPAPKKKKKAAVVVKQHSSTYRGVSRHRRTGRYEAHLWDPTCWKGPMKHKGGQATEEAAAEAYDIAAIKFRGFKAVTNFDRNRYDVEAIASMELPIRATSTCIKQAPQTISSSQVTVANPIASQNPNVVPDSFPNPLRPIHASSPSGSLPHPGIKENELDLDELHWLVDYCPYDDLFDNKHRAEDSSDPLWELNSLPEINWGDAVWN